MSFFLLIVSLMFSMVKSSSYFVSFRLFDGSEGKPPLTKVVVDVGAIEAARQVLKPYKTHLESLEEKNRNDFQK